MYHTDFFQQVNLALAVDQTKKQWVDLGIHTEVCMTRMTCGAAGGAISLWMNVIACENYDGLLTSGADEFFSGLYIFCFGSRIR